MKHYHEFEIEESLLTQLDALVQARKCSRDEIICEALKAYLGHADVRSQPPEVLRGDKS